MLHEEVDRLEWLRPSRDVIAPKERRSEGLATPVGAALDILVQKLLPSATIQVANTSAHILQ